MIVPTCSSRSARVRLPETRPLTTWTASMCRAVGQHLEEHAVDGQRRRAAVEQRAGRRLGDELGRPLGSFGSAV